MGIIYGSKELERDYGPLTFGKALWAHRKCEEIPQKDFARLLGISASTLYKIEKGKQIPSPDLAAKIADRIDKPKRFWIELAFKDMLREAGLNYKVTVK